MFGGVDIFVFRVPAERCGFAETLYVCKLLYLGARSNKEGWGIQKRNPRL